MTLREFLQRTGKTQREFAKDADIDPARLNRILRGTVEPTLEQAFRIEAATAKMVRAETWVRR